VGVSALSVLVAGSVWASGRVYSSPEAVKPLAPGAQVPAAQVKSVRGKSVELADELRENGALLVFYRGGW